MCLSWRRCSSALTRTLVQPDPSIASVLRLHCSFCSGLHCYVGQWVNQSLSTHDNKETEEWPNKCNWYCDGNLYFRTDSKGNLTSTRLFWKFFIHTKRSRKTLRRLPCRELHCLNKRYNFILFLCFWKWKVAFHLHSDQCSSSISGNDVDWAHIFFCDVRVVIKSRGPGIFPGY